MRLTLRTLLAYRDGVLSSAETSNLHHRIKQTEVANNLMRRIELLTQQKQMLAPKVIGTGLGADANSVAEYLDDTLPSDQVAEFERICIAESDLVLTELAHCHQLLADALNSKVHVPASLKTLVAGLSNPENQAALASRIRPPRNNDKNGEAINLPVASDGTQRRVDVAHLNALVPAQVVSEEIQEPQATRDKTAAGLINGKATQSALRDSATDAKAVVTAPIDVMNSQVSKPQPNSSLASAKQSHHVPDYLVTHNSGGWKFPLAIAAVLGLFVVLAVQALGPLTNIQNLFVATNTTGSNEKSAANDPSPIKVNPKSQEVDAGKQQLPPEPSVPASVPAVNDKAAEPRVKEATGAAETEQPIAPEKDATAAPDAEKPNEPSVIPTLPDNRTIRWQSATDAEARSVVFVQPNGAPRSFSRLSPDSPVGNDVALVVPPAMRPKLNLTDVCSWTVCGPSKIQPSVSGNGSVLVKTSLCRALLKANAAGGSLSVVAPAGSADVAFNEANSGASIEVAYRTASAGPITDRNVFKPIVIIVAVEGEIAVTPKLASADAAGSKPIRLNVGEGIALLDGQATEFELGSIPTWYRTNADRQIDLLAAEDMHQLLNDGGNIEAKLSAMCAERRPETSALAIQSSLMLGDWRGFASSVLNEEMMRTHWPTTLALAEQMLADDPKQIDNLSRELEEVFGESSSNLTSLLIGTNAVQPSSDNQKAFQQQLLDSLTSDQLPVRVLAAHQLIRLTGKDYGFQPATPNRAAVQQWRRELAANKLGSSLNPNVLWEAKRGDAEQ